MGRPRGRLSATGGAPPRVDVRAEDLADRIRALLEERRGYEVRGLTERAELVNDELRRLGAEGVPPRQRAEVRPAPMGETR